MNNTLSRVLLGFLVAIPGVVSTVALAQSSTTSDDGTTLAEVIVTAQKREERLQDVPIPISVVSEKELNDQHVYNIADLARTAPALEMIQAFGGPGGGGQIRGIGTTSFTASAEGAVGIVVDGVPQGNANATNIFDMQRVEVLRGPQGTLFGLTSSAGVINMVTVAPDPTKLEFKAHVDYSDKGTAGSLFGQQTFRGVANLPINDQSALRLSANVDTLKGVQRNSFTGVDHRRTDTGFRARYKLSVSDQLEVNLIADYNHFTANYFGPEFTYAIVPAGTPLANELAACGITASFANQSRCSNLSNKSSEKNTGLSAQFDWSLASATLTSITGYRKNETGPDDVDIMSTPAEVPQIFSTGAIGTTRQISQELRLASPSGQTVEYTTGLFYSDFLATSGVIPGGAFKIGFFPAPGVFVPFTQTAGSGRTTNKAVAAFGQVSYHTTDKLTLIAGARFTRQKLENENAADPLARTPATVPIELTKSNVSGKVGLQYKFVDNLTGYVTATRGYKGPQIQSAAQGIPATVINAEIPTAYEVGLKGNVLGNRLGIDLNAFSTKVKNYQGQRCALTAVGFLACTPESVDVTTKGFEASLNAAPVRGLALSGGVIYDVAEYPTGWTGYNPDDLRTPNRDANGVPVLGPGTTNLGGEQLVGAPRTKFTFNFDYSHALGSVMGFVTADTVHKSDLRLGPSGDPRFVFPAHWTTGARIGVRSANDRWSVAAFGRNIGNSHEPATIFGGPAFIPPGVVPFAPNGRATGISGWVTQNSLRQVGLSVDARF